MRTCMYIVVMTDMTYLIRMQPLTIFKKQITNRFVRSFLFYVPYACLTAMTIPAIFYATSSVASAAIGLAAAVILSFMGGGLPTVAAIACIAVFVAERFIH